MAEPVRVLWGDVRHGLRLIEVKGKARLQITKLVKYDPPTYEWWGEDRELPGVHGIAVLDIANQRDRLAEHARQVLHEIGTDGDVQAACAALSALLIELEPEP